MYKVIALSESGLSIQDHLIKLGFSLTFPYYVRISERGGNDNDGLPIVYKSDMEDSFENWISLGHYIFEEIKQN